MYLAWRVEKGFNEEIEISFLIVGHTKFAPDWCFGLFKRAFRKASIGCLEDIAAVCERSSKVNYAQLVGKQDGTPIVPTYDWGTYLPPNFKRDPFKGIKKLHHMRFTRSKPGVCFVHTAPDAAVKELKILSEDCWNLPPDEMPPIIKPEGLSVERRKYLFGNFVLQIAKTWFVPVLLVNVLLLPVNPHLLQLLHRALSRLTHLHQHPLYLLRKNLEDKKN